MVFQLAMIPSGTLLVIIATASLLVLLLQIGIFRRLGRIERALSGNTLVPNARDEVEDGGVSVDSSGMFRTFLEEDPARRELTKSEQFAAYRKWRSDKGLNWRQS